MNQLPESSEIKPAAVTKPIPGDRSQRILVVEDDGAIRRLSAQVLVSSGYRVAAAEDGVAGWEVLHASEFDLMITDHNMPRLSGLDLIHKLRSERMTLPVILATGSSLMSELDQNPLLQVAATLLKPFSVCQLLETVKEVLRAAGLAGFGSDNGSPLAADTFRPFGITDARALTSAEPQHRTSHGNDENQQRSQMGFRQIRHGENTP